MNRRGRPDGARGRSRGATGVAELRRGAAELRAKGDAAAAFAEGARLKQKKEAEQAEMFRSGMALDRAEQKLGGEPERPRDNSAAQIQLRWR